MFLHINIPLKTIELMTLIYQAISQMISVSETEYELFMEKSFVRLLAKNEIITQPGVIPNEIFFINKGLIRVMINDHKGVDHTIHFAMENQFISDYTHFMQMQPSIYTLQALENTEVVVLPRSTIDWGYKNLKEGEKMGRLIAEYYFMYQDDRIRNTYLRTPKERYESMSSIFPNIHQRVPQHMIASYLGISPIHLSRVKKSV